MTTLFTERWTAPLLRPYQHEASEKVASAFASGSNRLLVKKPTGTGKTVWFAALLPYLESRFPAVFHSAVQKGARMLVIAHREELLDQAADKIQAANPQAIISIEQADRHAHGRSDIIIASIQTLAAGKFRRLKRLLERHDPRLVIVDEAHHSASPTYRTALVHLRFLPAAEASDREEIEAAEYDAVAVMQKALEGWDLEAPKDRLLIGVTATPNRSDAIGLGCVYQTIAYSYTLRQAIADEWLVPIQPWVVETETSLDDVRITAGEFNQKDLGEAVNTERRNALAVAAWQQYALGKPTIGFTVNVAHAHSLAEAFVRAGHRWEALSGETPKDDRRIMLRQYKDRQIVGIANCLVLTEGTDLPLTECILHAKPTTSATLYTQMTGRGLRLYPGKEYCTVIDIVDIARRHSLQAAPVLYGLPPSLVTKGVSLETFAAELEALREKYPRFDMDAALASGRMTLEQLQARASSFDVWSVPELGSVGEGLTLNWIRFGETYRVTYPWGDGHEALSVQPDLIGKYEVVCTLRPSGDPRSVRQRTLAADMPSPAVALAHAETFVQQERRTVLKLKDREAPWRSGKASEKQLMLLAKFRVPHDPRTITKGHASDLLDIAFSRKGR